MKTIDRDYVINHIKGYIKANIAFILVLISIFVGCSYKILKDGYNELTLIPIIALVLVGVSTLYGVVINIIAIKLSSNMLKDFENFAYQKNIYTVTRVIYTGNKNNSKRFRADYIDNSNLSMSNMSSSFVDVPDGTDLDSLAGTNLVCLKFGNSDKVRKLSFLEACNDIQL